ncbi:MAG TPA: cell division protein FtsL [Nitrospirales bacterium]|nr:cell division protein FtsL [Nitrospirales bacterium]
MKFLAGTVLLALALGAVWEKMDIYRTGYAIEHLQVRKKQAQQEQKTLRLELARLTAPDQIERVAVSRLGMTRPRYNQVVLVQGVSPPSRNEPVGRVVRASHTQ